MKRLSLLFIAVIIASGCTSEEEKTYSTTLGMFTPYVLYPETLQGKVKSIVEKNYFVKEEDGKFVKGDPITIAARDTFGWTNDFKVMFNEMGLLIKTETLDENDKVIYVDENIIEDDKIVQSNYLKGDTLKIQTLIMYDENGFMKKMKTMRMPEDTLIRSVEMKSDSTGMLKGFRIINSNGEKGYSYKFQFDENGVNTGYTAKNPAGEQTLVYTMLKNEKGFMTQQTFSNAKGESVTDITYEEYDEMGNWTKSSATNDATTRVITERIMTYYEE